ncbi:MAG: SPOR domain-containing protein [Vicinamibacterales bacterium]
MASADDDVREIQLSGKQLVFLFMAVTVVSVVIFLCGVLVGRGVQLHPAAVAEQGSAAPTDVVPDPTAPAAQPAVPANEPTRAADLGFQEDLKAKTPTTDKITTTAPVPVTPVEQNPGKAGAPSEKPADARAGAGAAATAKSADAKSADAKSTDTKPAESKPADTKAADTKATDAKAADTKSAPAKAAEVATPSKLFPEPRGDGFAIQVTALSGKSEAEAIADRLKRKGYAVYLVSAPAGQPATYKVRVGKFKVRTEAEKIASRLEREEQFKPWITR